MTPSLLKHLFSKARFAALAWILLVAWVGCSDPGSGGSGIPSSTTQDGGASSPAPSLAAAPSLVVTALTAESVTLSGVSYALADIAVQAASASTAAAAPTLALGMKVTLTDLGTDARPRYRLLVLSP